MTITSEAKTYTYSNGWKWFLGICSAFLILLGPVCFFGIVYGEGKSATATRVVVVGLAALAMFALGLGLLRGLLTFRVTLLADRLVYHSGISLVEIRKEEIVAIRTQGAGSVAELLLMGHGGRKLARITLCFAPDQCFCEWFSGITDLNEEERREDERRIANDTSLGVTPNARFEAAAAGRVLARRVDLASIIIGLLTIVYPKPYELMVGLTSVMPILGIVLLYRFRGFIQLDSLITSPRNGLDATLLVPCCALSARALYDARLVAPASLVTPTVVLTLALLSWLRLAQREVSAWKFVLFGCLFWGYPASVLALGNRILDTAPATASPVSVIEKRETSGERTTRYLTLGPGGPWDSAHEVEVSKKRYDSALPGGDLCLLIRPGAFRMSWWSLRARCDEPDG